MDDCFWFWKKLKRMARQRWRGGLVDAHNHPFTEGTSSEEQYYKTAFLPLEAGSLDKADKWKEVDRLRPELLKTFRERLDSAIRRRMKQGIKAGRSYVDLVPVIGLEAVEIAVAAKKFWAGAGYNLQIAVYPMEGIDTEEKRVLLEGACRIPEVEAIGCTPSRGRSGVSDTYTSAQHIDYYAGIAHLYGKILDAQLDQANHPEERETELFARAIKAHRSRGYDRPAGATHCVSMSCREDSNLVLSVLQTMRECGISMIVCPRAFLHSRTKREVRTFAHNSIAPWDLAVKMGVNVALGMDNVSDIYMPHSDGDIWYETDTLINSVRYDGDLKSIADILTINGQKALFG